MKRYTILLDPDAEDGSYTVTVPALPGIVAQSKDLDDAIAMAKDAIRCHTSGLLKDGERIPEEYGKPQLITIEVDVNEATCVPVPPLLKEAPVILAGSAGKMPARIAAGTVAPPACRRRRV